MGEPCGVKPVANEQFVVRADPVAGKGDGRPGWLADPVLAQEPGDDGGSQAEVVTSRRHGRFARRVKGENAPHREG